MKILRAFMLGFGLATLFAACSSIPLSTIAKLSQFNKESFMALNPEEVRMKVTVPQGFVIDPAKTHIMIKLKEEDSGEAMDEKLEMKLIQSSPTTKSAGIFQGQSAATEFELALTGKGKQLMRDIQTSLKRQVRRQLELRVGQDFMSRPAGAKSVTFWIELQVSKLDGYFLLVDGATIEMKEATAVNK